ncbi:gustatory and odorant receptor 22-like [Cimex lectularius]|uniref:Gustatory receptor n=1 Tax=Cimex lectularius TaxID=79782 RepID=A0A8I6RLL2_CIMLE|nr:gustatory and odorant receptor 22-like [Cimex lectularius]XP_024083260.1 gustatory and odorant receptor 22-like [Cimex lectularius]XP_024083261.1 gustatory and odorant receptor 22-like [Cimex lectularius]WGT79548.1 GR1 [Cimex lectularius]
MRQVVPHAAVVPTVSMPQEDEKKSQHPRSDKNVFYEQFKPMFVILILFGRLSITRIKGKYEWRYMSLLMIYCIVNYALQSYIVFLVCKKRFDSLMDAQRNYDELIFAMHILAYLSIHFHLPFTYWAQGPKLAEYINMWKRFQDEWFLTFGDELKLSLKRFIRWFSFSTIPSVVLLLVFEKYSTLHDPWLYLMPYLFTIVSTMLALGLWYCTCIEINRLSKKSTVRLIQHIETKPNAAFLRQWRHLWISLSSLSSWLGSHLSGIIASIFLTFSLTFLLGLYNALSLIIKLDISWKAIGYLSASTLSLCIIYTLCDAGQKGSKEISTYAFQEVLKTKLASNSLDIRYELSLLIKSIEANLPEIELAGFVTMNRSLFISFVSNTITYLIVILQFKFN